MIQQRPPLIDVPGTVRKYIQDLENKIDSQQEEISEQENEIIELNRLVEDLESKLASTDFYR